MKEKVNIDFLLSYLISIWKPTTIIICGACLDEESRLLKYTNYLQIDAIARFNNLAKHTGWTMEKALSRALRQGDEYYSIFNDCLKALPLQEQVCRIL